MNTDFKTIAITTDNLEVMKDALRLLYRKMATGGRLPQSQARWVGTTTSMLSKTAKTKKSQVLNRQIHLLFQ